MHPFYRAAKCLTVVVLIILNDDLLTANIQFGAAAESDPQWYKLTEQLNKNLLNASLTEQTHINWVSNKHIHSQHKLPAFTSSALCSLLLLKHETVFMKKKNVVYHVWCDSQSNSVVSVIDRDMCVMVLMSVKNHGFGIKCRNLHGFIQLQSKIFSQERVRIIY